MPDIASFVAKCNAAAAEVLAIPAGPLPVGVRIRVTASAKVRAQPDSAWPGLLGSPQPVGAMGTARAGMPQTNGFWFIDFDTGPSGWVWPANFVVV